MKHIALLLLITTLSLTASKTPAQLIKDYAKAGLPGKTKALQALLTFSPSDMPDKDFDAVATIINQLRAEKSSIISNIAIDPTWQAALAKSQGSQSATQQREQAAIARALAERKAKHAKEDGASSAAAATPSSGRTPPPLPPLPKPKPTAGKVPPPLPPVPATKKPAPPAQGLGEADEKAGVDRLLLVSREHAKLPISRAIAIRFSNLIKNALDADKNAPEVDVPRVSRNVLQKLIDIMQFFDSMRDSGELDKEVKRSLQDQYHYVEDRFIASNPATIKKVTQEILGNTLAGFNEHVPETTLTNLAANIKESLPELILAAFYIDAPEILDALLYRYLLDRKLENDVWEANLEQEAVEAGLQESHEGLFAKRPELKRFPLDLLKLLSKLHFLQRKEDIDLLLGLTGENRTHISFDDLLAHGFFNRALLEAAPNLAKDPNAAIKAPHSMSAVTPPDGKAFTALSLLVASFAPTSEGNSNPKSYWGNLRTLEGLLKLRGIDPNKGQAIRAQSLKKYPKMAERVLYYLRNAGATD